MINSFYGLGAAECSEPFSFSVFVEHLPILYFYKNMKILPKSIDKAGKDMYNGLM